MKQTLVIVTIILGTFIMAFITSLLLELNIISGHWLRQSLVILFVALELFVGGFMLYTFSKSLVKK